MVNKTHFKVSKKHKIVVRKRKPLSGTSQVYLNSVSFYLKRGGLARALSSGQAKG